MKKLILMACFVIGISAMSHAQGRQQRSPADQAKQLQTQLTLTDDQTAKVQAIYEGQAKKRDSVMTAANGDRQAMMSAMRPMMEATNTKIKAILTADQAKAWDKIQEERKARMQQGGGMGGGGGTPPPPTK